MKPKEKMFMVVGTVAVMASSGIIGYSLFVTPDATANGTSSAQSSSTQTVTSTSNPAQSTATSPTSSSYKDGTYSGKASYMVPHGHNSISVTVEIKDSKIVSASAQHDYTDHESGMYVDEFDSSLDTAVTGESVESLSPSRIGGASLTTDAFDNVLDTIRSEASA